MFFCIFWLFVHFSLFSTFFFDISTLFFSIFWFFWKENFFTVYSFSLYCIILYFVLCTLYFVLCTLYFVLCTLYFVLCTLYFVLCTLYFVLCTLYFVLCTLYFALCTLYFVLCTLHFALCTLHFALCTLHFALCTLHFALCTLHFALTSSGTCTCCCKWPLTCKYLLLKICGCSSRIFGTPLLLTYTWPNFRLVVSGFFNETNHRFTPSHHLVRRHRIMSWGPQPTAHQSGAVFKCTADGGRGDRRGCWRDSDWGRKPRRPKEYIGTVTGDDADGDGLHDMR